MTMTAWAKINLFKQLPRRDIRSCQIHKTDDNTSDIIIMSANLPINDDMIDIYGVID